MSEIDEAEVVQPTEDTMKLVPTPAVQPAQCGQCAYLQESPIQPGTLTRSYECRRFPPQVQALNLNGQLMMVGQFPPVQLLYWCGEFAR